jgi:hypothetical protein
MPGHTVVLGPQTSVCIPAAHTWRVTGTLGSLQFLRCGAQPGHLNLLGSVLGSGLGVELLVQ